MSTRVNNQTGELLGIPARDRYVPPPVRSPEWISELRRASEECELLLWGLASKGEFTDANELYVVAKAHKIAKELTKLANEKLSQIGYGTNG
jgi:hypothetical protein